ncbi:MAG: hypothetical protein R6X05_13640 [Desulfobacterales bacterium]|jgi:hypothetical protein
MNPWAFMVLGWPVFLPMACMSFFMGNSKSSIDSFEPGTMFLLNEEGEREGFKVGEYDKVFTV